MSFTEPPKSLDNACTVVYENTLYSYNTEGFLSLHLEEGAEWKELEQGAKVTGSTCVGSTPGNAAEAGFFIVGGKGDSAEYTGLQKYTYSTGKWTNINIPGEATNGRQGHSCVYIPANDVLLIYGGENGASGASSQTFTVKASEPHTPDGYVGIDPPGQFPNLLQWGNADALLLGGNGSNKEVFFFNPTAGWRRYGASLREPLKDSSAMKVAVVTGSDGSQSILTFDMTQSPNRVERIVLQDASGMPVQDSPAIGRRDLTLSDWPEYDSSGAPSETRANFAMAQAADGKVIFSGGSAEHPIRVFDFVQNNWVNEVRLLSEQKPLDGSSTAEDTSSTVASTSSEVSSTTTRASSTTSAATTTSASSTVSSATSLSETTATSSDMTSTSATSTASNTAAAIAGGSKPKDDNLSSGTVLGITLGAIVGFLLLLGLILLLLRRRKRRHVTHAESGQSRGLGGLPAGAKADFDAYTKEIGTSEKFRGHRQTNSQDSFSSVAILMGRLGQPKSGLTRKASHDTSRSSVGSLHKQFKSKISKPILQVSEPSQFQGNGEKGVAFASNVAEPRPRNLLAPEDGMRRSSGWNKYWSGGSALQLLGFGGQQGPQRSTVASQHSSNYSESPTPNSRRTQDSATVPPLNFVEGPAGLNRVNTGSPIVSQYSGDVHLKEEMAGKIERPISRASSGYSSGVPESINESWDPVDSNKPWGAARAPSSAYTGSVIYNTPLAPGANGARNAPSGMSTQPQLAMASKSSDMSWLNLGDQRRG